jgi:plastocyanin
MRRILGWSVVVLVAVGVLAASGAFGAVRGASARTARAGASETFTVNVDGKNPAVNESFDAFYPHIVTVHPGDTVVFHYAGNGEPHTVALGTLAAGAVTAFDKLAPAEQQNPPKSALAADGRVPQFTGKGGAIVQAAANPCYLASGEPSARSACPAGAQPAFDGTQSYYDSGWLKANENFTVHLSSSIAPGSYAFMCLVHREGMQGKITVVPAAAPVASPSAQAATGAAELAKDEAQLVGPAGLLAEGRPPIPGATLPGANPVLVGSGNPGAGAGQIDLYGPKSVHIPVGRSVTWWLTGVHTITFNANSTDNDVQRIATNGDVSFNVKAVAPVGGPGEPPPAGPPSGGTSIKFKLVTSSSWNGEGFHNSGLFVNSFPPNIEGYKLTFTRAGTYHYICTVHDNMKGTVVVGGG